MTWVLRSHIAVVLADINMDTNIMPTKLYNMQSLNDNSESFLAIFKCFNDVVFGYIDLKQEPIATCIMGL